MASECLNLLLAISDAFSDWSAGVGKMVQYLTGGVLEHADLPNIVFGMHEASFWLPLATGSLVLCMLEHQIWDDVGRRQLLDTLGQLVHKAGAGCPSCCVSMSHLPG